MAALIDVRDEMAAARDLAMALCLACSAPTLPRDERAALGQLAALVRTRLAALLTILDDLIGNANGQALGKRHR